MNVNETKLRAGAGKAIIEINNSILPTPEGYSVIHDLPQARVLVLDCGVRVAILYLELVSVTPDITKRMREIVAEETGTPFENVWQNVTHSLETPHGWSPRNIKTDDDKRKAEEYENMRETAVRSASRQAIDNLQPAFFGSSIGYCEVNTNRIIETKNGYWHGRNDDGPCDHSVATMMLCSCEEKPIAIFFNYHCQPAIMDMSRGVDGTRYITADLAGATSKYVESIYPGAVAIYATGAGGDQWPAMRAVRWKLDGEKNSELIDMHEDGFAIVEASGEALGAAVVKACRKIRVSPITSQVKVVHETIKVNGQVIPETREIRPRREYTYVPDGEKKCPIEIIAIGDTAIIGVQPEIDCKTVEKIKSESPFKTNMVLTFTNGGAKYMVQRYYYEKVTYQSMNSRYAEGSAELLADRISELLQEI